MNNITPLQKAQQTMRDRRAAGEIIERLDPITKSSRNPNSLRLAVNGKCWDCANESRDEIKRCDIKKCTLWHVRPYQSKDEGEV